MVSTASTPDRVRSHARAIRAPDTIGLGSKRVAKDAAWTTRAAGRSPPATRGEEARAA